MKTIRKLHNRKAFTIVELVIVIAVIAILASVLVPSFGGIVTQAQESAAKQAAKNAHMNYLIEHDGSAPEVMVYKHSNGKVVALVNGAPTNIYETEEEFFAAYSLPKFEMVAGKAYPISMSGAPDEDEIPLQLNLTVSDYFTVSNPDTEKLSCGPGMVYYGRNRMAVAYKLY